MSLAALPTLLDYAAVVVFAWTGALVASRAQLDVIGFLFLACLTAVGGGTVRDLLLGRDPVFWIDDPLYILLACIAAIVVFFTAHLLTDRYRLLVWLDALALAMAASVGIAVAQQMGQSAFIQVLMGVITGCLGGLMRDVVANEVPMILKQGEFYVTAAFAGALAEIAAQALSGSENIGLIACVCVTFGLRAGSLLRGWHLPTYKAYPPRTK
ncbi:trimeric intracellular cation channel family protein [Pseudoruegeria sp. SK021]|uniref:trimeric intracellular cation channel family protein n=1 Tax=Pseudoruegeria sp. SK021 TaxID=1933035 RepID=UPI000A220909|nr:trimeric intracellular cation channel family protein [Pseudoruegeria sp. SK021]OSP55182.1 hypothetical protein BV911_09145 [Pseudoruegeria sp. SK021]